MKIDGKPETQAVTPENALSSPAAGPAPSADPHPGEKPHRVSGSWISQPARRRNSIVTRRTLLFLADLLTIVFCFGLAYYLRFYIEFLAITTFPIPNVTPYLRGGGLLAAIWLLLNWRSGCYQTQALHLDSPIQNYGKVVTNGLWAIGLLLVFSVMARTLLLSRQVYLMTAVTSCTVMIVLRAAIKTRSKHVREGAQASDRLVVLGSGKVIDALVERVQISQPRLTIAGRLSWGDSPEDLDDAKVPFLGGIHDIEVVFGGTPFDILVVSSLDWARHEESGHGASLLEIVNYCESQGISLYQLPGMLDIAVSHREVGTFSDMPVIRIQDAALHPFYALVKRVFDILLSLAILSLGLPLWFLIAIAIKLTSRGPVLFSQQRAGLHGRPFNMFKFRSMVVDAEGQLSDLIDVKDLDEPVFKIANDPRVTPIGRLLRRTSLDEIPQVINVLLGQMSMVGPRPEEVIIVSQYDVWQRRRLKAKPGITGYQQISNRGSTSLSDRVRFDLYYLKHQGFLMDLYILFQTVFVVIRGDGTTR